MTTQGPPPAPGPGRAHRQDPGRPRRGLQGQDRRPRHQGHQGPLPGPGRLRGRPDAAPHAAAEAQGLQEPVPDRVPGRQPRPARRAVPRRRRGRRRTTSSTRAPSARASSVKVLGTGDLAVALQVTAHAFSGSAAEKITAAGGTVTELYAGDTGRWPQALIAPVTGCYSRRLRCPATWRPRIAAVPDSRLAQDAQEDPCSPRSRRAFRTPDLRKKLLFTLGDHRPVPARLIVPDAGRVDYQNIHSCIDQVSKDVRDSTGWSTCSAAARCCSCPSSRSGIMPYITASIIIQLLVVVIPRLEQLKKEGQSGQAEAHAVHALPDHRRWRSCSPPASSRWPAAGAAVPGLQRSRSSTGRRLFRIVDDGHHDDRRHRGHHVARRADHRPRRRQRHVAADLHLDRGPASRAQGCAASCRPRAASSSSLVCLLGLAIIAAVVFVEQAQRRIPVQYAKRMVGRRMYGGTSTYIPLKVNQAGVIPVIFASSLLYLPQLLSPGLAAATSAWQRFVAELPRRAATTRSTCCSTSR